MSWAPPAFLEGGGGGGPGLGKGAPFDSRIQLRGCYPLLADSVLNQPKADSSGQLGEKGAHVPTCSNT